MHKAGRVKTFIYIDNWWTLKIYFHVSSFTHFIPKTFVNLKAKLYLTEVHLLISYGRRWVGKDFFKMLLFSATKEMMLEHHNWTQTWITWTQFCPLQNLTWLRCLCVISWLIWTLLWRRPRSHRNQSPDLYSKSMDWFRYNRDLCHEGIHYYVNPFHATSLSLNHLKTSKNHRFSNIFRG